MPSLDDALVKLGTATPAPGGHRSLDDALSAAPPTKPPGPFEGIKHAAGAAVKGYLDAAEAAQKRNIAGLQWLSNTPVAHGLDAALNATSRAGTAAVAGKNPAKAVIDPAHATEYTHGAEHNILHNALHIPDIPADAWKNPWLSTPLRIGQVGLDFATETGLDAATYVPGLDAFSVGKRLVGAAGKVGSAIAKVPTIARGIDKAKPVTDKVASVVDRMKTGAVEGHDLRKGVQRSGENIVKGHEIAGTDATHREEQSYADLVEKHRPALDAIDEQRAGIRARLTELDPLAKLGHQKSTAEVNALHAAYRETYNHIPPEIRDAYNRRAYLEGTPEVRRQVEKRGFKPSAEDAAQPVINKLHGLNDEYEPTQKIFEKKDLDWSGAPVQYVKQGRMKAPFDQQKTGGEPDAPLADRILDRLVTGARVTNNYATRAKILRDLGLSPISETSIARTRAALDAARASGDTAKVARLEQLSQRQDAAQQASEQLRTQHLQPGTEDEATQKIERVDPRLAQQRTLNNMRKSGELSETTRIDPKTGKMTGLLKPGASPRDTRGLQGTVTAGRRAVTDAEQFAHIAGTAADRTAGAVARAGQQPVASAQNLLNSAIRTKAETADRLSGQFPNPPSGLLDPEGRPINVPRTANSFNDRKVATTPPPPAPAPTLIGGAQRARTLPQARRLLNPPPGKPPSLQPPQGPIPRILDASGNAVRKPTVAETAQAHILRPIGRLTEQIGRQAERQPPTQNLIGPSQTGALHAAQRAGKVTQRLAGREQRLASETERNSAIEEVRKRADELGDKANVASMPAALQRRLYGDKEIYRKGLMYDFSELQRDALFVIPFAHMKNITILALLGPKGPKVVSGAQRYFKALKDDPAALDDRVRNLEQIGASAHYIGRARPTYAKLGKVGEKLGDVAEKSNAMLERYDMAMRLSLEDELKAQGKTGFTAGGQIRDVLGDYTNQAPVIQKLRNDFGANFPAWGLGIVPRAMTKAMRENPRAMKAYVRLDRLFSDDVTQPMFGTDFSAGGPVDDWGGMLFPKPAASNYYTSQARLGWPGLIAPVGAALARGKGVQEAGAEALRFVPGGTLLENATGFPYPSGAPGALRTAAGLAGAYFPNHMNAKQRSNQLRQLGIKGPEVHQILQSEGYYPQPTAVPAPTQSRTLDAALDALK